MCSASRHLQGTRCRRSHVIVHHLADVRNSRSKSKMHSQCDGWSSPAEGASKRQEPLALSERQMRFCSESLGRPHIALALRSVPVAYTCSPHMEGTRQACGAFCSSPFVAGSLLCLGVSNICALWLCGVSTLTCAALSGVLSASAAYAKARLGRSGQGSRPSACPCKTDPRTRLANVVLTC